MRDSITMEARSTAEKELESARMRLRAAANKLDLADLIKENPLASEGIALALGFAIAYIPNSTRSLARTAAGLIDLLSVLNFEKGQNK
jgi:hypothetical protein